MPKTKTLEPTTARVKPLKPRGKSTGWKCDSCKSTNPAGEVFCKCGGLTPALIGIERALADVLGPNDDLAVVWPMLRETGATDDGIRGAIVRSLGWYSVPTVISEPYSVFWTDLAAASPKMWFEDDASRLLEDVLAREPDMAGAKLIATVRSIFGIPDIDGVPIEAPKASTPAKADNPKSKIENPKSPDQVRYLAVSTIRVSSANPRKEFSQHAHTQLVESIQSDGLLQPLTVRPAGDGSFELLAGERRLRAAKSAGLKEVPALIRHDVDDAKAARIRLAENYVRENLNPIEEAEAFRTLLDEHGFTQRELAEYFGLSQAKIANDVRMLKLPPVWRERVISREITKTQARDLATWCDVPGVMDVVDRILAEDDPWERPPGERIMIIEEALESAVFERSRPMQRGWHRIGELYGEVRLTPKDLQRDDLDVREVTFGGRTVRRAFNVPRWDELQAAGQARADKAAAKRLSPVKDSGRAEKQQEEFSAAERKQKAQQKAEQYRRRLEAWYHDWLRGRIIAKLEALPVMADDSAIFPALSMLLEISADPRELSKLFGGQIEELVRSKVIESLRRRIGECYSDLSPDDVRWIANRIGVSLETDWAGPTADFLEVHDKAQLAVLAKEWGRAADVAEKRTDTIAALVDANVKPPKALLKLVKGLK